MTSYFTLSIVIRSEINSMTSLAIYSEIYLSNRVQLVPELEQLVGGLLSNLTKPRMSSQVEQVVVGVKISGCTKSWCFFTWYVSAFVSHNFASATDFEVPQSTHACFEQQFEGANQLPWSRRQECNIDLPAPITPSLTSRCLHQSGGLRERNWPKSSRSQGNSALAAAAAMRITPDLHQRSRKKSLRTSRHKFLVLQIFFSFPP